MNAHVFKHYKKVMDRLEHLEKQVHNRRGYTKESRNLRILIELIKEQFPHESAGNTTSPLR